MTLRRRKIIKCQARHWQQNGWQKVNEARTVWSVRSRDGSRAAGRHTSCEQSINHFALKKNKAQRKGRCHVYRYRGKHLICKVSLIYVCMRLAAMIRNNRPVKVHIVLQPISLYEIFLRVKNKLPYLHKGGSLKAFHREQCSP